MKPSDIITESIEHRELEEAPMGFWKNLGYKVAGSVLNPFGSKRTYQKKQEIGKRANELEQEFRSYLGTVPGSKATVSNLLKWLKFQNLDTAGVERMIGNQSRAGINTTGIMSNTSWRDSAKTADLPTIDTTRLGNKPLLRDPGPMAVPNNSNRKNWISESGITYSTVLSPEQVDKLILRAITDTANKEYFEPSAQIDAQGTQSASSEPTPQSSTTQPASSEPTSQQSSATSAQQSASSEPAPQPSLATSAQPKDELNDIRRLSGMVNDHEDRIKKLEAGKTDNRVKFTGKKTGT
jgi:hypothetical protein